MGLRLVSMVNEKVLSNEKFEICCVCKMFLTQMNRILESFYIDFLLNGAKIDI